MVARNSDVSRREWLVAGAAAATLAFTACGLGGIPTWTLHTLFLGGLVTLLLAICPFSGVLRSPLSTLQFPLRSLKRLAIWPPFYFSLAFLIYLLIGALNPAAEVLQNESGWWVRAIQPRWPIWLPTSVSSEYEPMNAWRVLEGFAGATALTWGIWAGLTRRKAALFILWSLLLSGSAMGLVGILQHLTHADGVLWTFPSSNSNFWGSFFYRNQGAAYLNLILISAGALYFYHARKNRQRARASGPHFLCFVLFASVVTSVGLSLSRGGIVFAVILSIIFFAFVVIHTLFGLEQFGSLWALLIPILFLASGAFILVRYIDFEAIEKRFGDVRGSIQNVDQDSRFLSSKATWDMAQDRLVLGWGPGSFRYIFPMYQRKYPEIHYHGRWPQADGKMGRKVYRYAHNDIVQFVAEYGLIGSGLIWLTLLWMVISTFRAFSFSACFLFLGFVACMCHAFLDFILNSPAYWFALVGLIVSMSKLVLLEARSTKLKQDYDKKSPSFHGLK